MELDQITSLVIKSAIEVHRHLGPGLLENAYTECLCYELGKNGLKVQKNFPLPVTYKEIKIDKAYFLDILVENAVVIELKSVESIKDEHKAQTLTYLRLGDYRVGLLINFNVNQLTKGVTRIVNRY